jgi:hypothetical protein
LTEVPLRLLPQRLLGARERQLQVRRNAALSASA